MLSIVVATRNDNHGGNMVERTNLFIRSVAAAAKKVNLETELVFVEWNPPSWAKALADVLEWPEQEGFSAKVITVSKAISDQLAAYPMEFYQMIAKNTGIRRANGNWILCTNPDTIYSPAILERIAGLPETPEEHNFYRAPRIDIIALPRPLPAEMGDILEVCEKNRARDRDAYQMWEGVHSWACGDFTLLHRDDWLDARGYPELEIWSIHVDSLFLLLIHRAMQLNEVWWDDLSIYHPEHPQSWAIQPKYGEEFPSLRHELGNIPVVADFLAKNGGRKLRLNNENWGLRDEQLSEIKVC